MAILWVTVPATIIRSDCRGVALGMRPSRSQSKRLAPAAIISMAQQARPNTMGQSADWRAQFTTASTRVRMNCWLPTALIRSMSFP